MYLRNCWYVAGHAEEATVKPLGRIFLDEPVVIFRTETGTLVAMDDRCPHRLAPLHKGTVCGEQIRCPYHGLRFSPAGMCTATPSGDRPPARARLKTYPLVERHEMLWIWMGEASLADTSLIPDFSRLTEDDADWLSGYLYVRGNYQLAVDNLLDLSHIEFLHPMLASPIARAHSQLEQEGDTVHFTSTLPDDKPLALALTMNPRLAPHGKTVMRERWEVPSLVFLSVEYYSATGDWYIPSGHFLTPETATTTHYFLRSGQTVDKYNAQMTEAFKSGSLHIFATEDIPMIEAQQKNIGAIDLMDHHPAILRTDAAAVRARRVLSRRIKEENSPVYTAVEAQQGQ